MNLEDQVIDINLSKKLKDLGIKYKSYFSWFYTKKYGDVIRESSYRFDLDDYLMVQRIGSAFTVAEIGEILPTLIPADTPSKSDIYLQYFKSEVWVCCFIKMPFQLTRIAEAENEANARAKMLIYLLENGYIKNE